LNIKLLSDEVGQIFNLKLSLLDGLQVVVIIGFLPKFSREIVRARTRTCAKTFLMHIWTHFLTKLWRRIGISGMKSP
jgi:hypothetical protein